MYYVVLLSYNAFAFIATIYAYWFFTGFLEYNQLLRLQAVSLLYVTILPVMMAVASRLYRRILLFEESVLSLLVMLTSILLLLESYQLGKHGDILDLPIYVSILVLLLVSTYTWLHKSIQERLRSYFLTTIVSLIIMSSLLGLDAPWFHEYLSKIMLGSSLMIIILLSITTLPEKALHSIIEPLALIAALVLQVLLLKRFFVTSMLFILFALLSLAWRNLFANTGCPFTKMPLLIKIGVILVPLAGILEFIRFVDIALIIFLISIYFLITGNTVPKRRYTSDEIDA